jgi:hypothetical protein
MFRRRRDSESRNQLVWREEAALIRPKNTEIAAQRRARKQQTANQSIANPICVISVQDDANRSWACKFETAVSAPYLQGVMDLRNVNNNVLINSNLTANFPARAGALRRAEAAASRLADFGDAQTAARRFGVRWSRG